MKNLEKRVETAIGKIQKSYTDKNSRKVNYLWDYVNGCRLIRGQLFCCRENDSRDDIETFYRMLVNRIREILKEETTLTSAEILRLIAALYDLSYDENEAKRRLKGLKNHRLKACLKIYEIILTTDPLISLEKFITLLNKMDRGE